MSLIDDFGLKTGGLQTGGLQTGGLSTSGFGNSKPIGSGVSRSDQLGVREGVQNFKRQERMGRRAYRQALRQNDPGRAYEIVKDMGQNGLSSGGIRQAGAVENRLMSQFQGRKAMLAPQARPASPAAVSGGGLPIPSAPAHAMAPAAGTAPNAAGPSRGPTMEMRNWEGVQNGLLGDRRPGDGLGDIGAPPTVGSDAARAAAIEDQAGGAYLQTASNQAGVSTDAPGLPVPGSPPSNVFNQGPAFMSDQPGFVQSGFYDNGPAPATPAAPAPAAPAQESEMMRLARAISGSGLGDVMKMRERGPLGSQVGAQPSTGPLSGLTPGVIASNSAMLNSDRMHERFSLLDQGLADSRAANDRSFQQHLDNAALYNFRQALGEKDANRHAEKSPLTQAFGAQPRTATPPRPVFSTTPDPGLDYKPRADRDSLNSRADRILEDVMTRLKSRSGPDADPDTGEFKPIPPPPKLHTEFSTAKETRALDPFKEKARLARVAKTEKEMAATRAKKSKR